MKKKIINNNKGFTLIELLAVIVILVSVSLVAVGGITSSLERRDAKEFEEQKKLAIGAAKIYFSLNNKTCVQIQDLIDGNYFSDNSKIDRLDSSAKIEFNSSDNKYEYVESSICDDLVADEYA